MRGVYRHRPTHTWQVRESFVKLHELLAKGGDKDATYYTKLEESGWLLHVASLLRGAAGCAHSIHARQRSVLVHCSDGWDRTAQV
jgi:myotubularin-related protein 6/7/8